MLWNTLKFIQEQWQYFCKMQNLRTNCTPQFNVQKSCTHFQTWDSYRQDRSLYSLFVSTRVKPCLQQCMIGVNHEAWNPIWSGQLRSAACLGGGWGVGEGRKVLTPPLHPSTTSHPPRSTALLTVSQKTFMRVRRGSVSSASGYCKAATSSNLARHPSGDPLPERTAMRKLERNSANTMNECVWMYMHIMKKK
jgi:hypothetical protein